MKNRFLLIALMFFSISPAVAQDFSLAGIEYFNYAKTNFTNVPTQQISASEIHVFVNLPMKAGKKTKIIHGFDYGFLQAETHNSTLFESTANQKDFKVFSYSMTAIHQINQKMRWMLQLQPTLASDFEEDLSSDDLVVQGTFLVSKQVSERFSYGLGVIYTTRFGEPQVLPALEFKHHNDRHTFTAILPAKIEYAYHVGQSKKLSIGLRASTNGANFNLTVQDFLNVVPSRINKVIYSRLNAGPVITYKLAKNLKIEAFGGATVARKFRLQDFDEDQFEFDADNGSFVNVSLKLVPGSKSAR